MGGSSNKLLDIQLGTLKIVLEANEFESGGELKGVILLAVKGNINLEECIHIEFVGEAHIDLDGIKTPRGYKKFVNVSTKISAQPSHFISPGHYTIPFDLIIPQGLPSCFTFNQERQGRKTYARVVYSVSASFINDIKDTVEIEIIERDRTPMTILPFNISSKVRYCCLSIGSAQSTVKYNKDSYRIGEELKVNLKYDYTACSLRPSHYKFELVCIIELFDGIKTRKQMKQTMLAKLYTVTSKVGDLELSIILSSTLMGDLYTWRSELFDFIKCNFFFVISPCFSRCVSIGELRIEKWIRISLNRTPIYFMPPENWNPVFQPKMNQNENYSFPEPSVPFMSN